MRAKRAGRVNNSMKYSRNRKSYPMKMLNDVLIEEVKKRPPLWYRGNANYKNRQIVDAYWDEIAKSLQTTKAEVKNRWKNLRDHFKKELNKSKANDYKGRWGYFYQMLFLRDMMVTKTCQEKAENGGSIKQEILFIDENSESGHNDNNQEGDSEIFADPLNSAVKSPTPTNNKKLRLESATKSDEQEPQTATVVAATAIEEDEELLFLKSLIPYMKQLAPIRRLHVRNQIQSILIEELSVSPAATVTEPPDADTSLQ